MDTIDKIKSVLNSNLSAYELEKRTGVSSPSIINMRKDTYDFSKMSFQIGENQGAFLTFTSSLDRFFTDTIKTIIPETIEEEALKEVLNKIKSETLKDSYMLEDMYDAYKDYMNKKG